VQHGDPGKPISLTARAADDDIEVRVANFGRPIPAASLQSIFEPMVRVPTAGKEVHEDSKTSLGLGLFIVHEIVTRHGGSVAVESSEEAGTAFTIRLPRADGTPMKERLKTYTRHPRRRSTD
uniref:sensor histidine kinase n=1 Tax=Polaromonas sp. TaxID=1869339 RepID=UPI0018025C0C